MVGPRSAVAGVMCAILTTAATLPAGDTETEVGGRVSPQTVVSTYPGSSTFHDIFGASSVDSAIDARVVFDARHGRWSLNIDYQAVALYADRLELTRELPEELAVLFPHLPGDRKRLFDLTHVFTDSGKTAALHRLDRLAVGFATDHLVMRFGRQAITWGNGLVFNVMDIFNPFDPAAVDKEYKTGDDMLYGQYLAAGGDDLQGVMVFRRDPVTGAVASEQSSLAAKYHHVGNLSEYDLLAARHYGDMLLGFGMNVSVGGAVWRGDLVLAWTAEEVVPSLVTSFSRSWTWNGTNVSGVAEYHYNGFGRSDGCYSPRCLAASPALLERVARGELFNVGQHYLALSAAIEVTPLFLLTPSVFCNLTDPSALFQVVLQNDLRENLLLWSAVNIPVGADGTEYGGAATELPGSYLSTGPSVSMQLVWYW